VVNAPYLVSPVRADVVFHKGELLERPTDISPNIEAVETASTGQRSPETHSFTVVDNISRDGSRRTNC